MTHYYKISAICDLYEYNRRDVSTRLVRTIFGFDKNACKVGYDFNSEADYFDIPNPNMKKCFLLV